MTSNETVVQLSSQKTAKQRILEFVQQSQNLSDVLISSHQWEEDVWATAGFIVKGQNRDTFNLYFYQYGVTKERGREKDGDPLAPDFKNFAKAYMRYMHTVAPLTWDTTKVRLEALKVIEHAFRKLGLLPEIENLTVAVMNVAIETVRSKGGESKQSTLASYVQQLFRFCKDRLFLNGPFEWRSAVKRTRKSQTLDQEAQKWRESRLPSTGAFHALGHIYANADTFHDKLLSSICAVMVSVPIRIHEVLQLRLECEVFTSAKSDKGEEVPRYGIRVWPGKGHPPQVKWVPTAMVSIAQEAIKRLKDLCAPGRAVAKWYEQHRSSPFVPSDQVHIRDKEWVDRMEIASLLGITDRDAVNAWLQARPSIRRRSSKSNRQLDEVNMLDFGAALVSMLPRGFPAFNGFDDQTFSDTLIVPLYNSFHGARATYACMIESCTVGLVQDWLNGSETKKTVFDRWGFKEPDGSRMRVNTHAFRHWLNTVAQLKGLSDDDIARWSGRTVSQNTAYNHVTSAEALSRLKEAIGDGNAIGPLFEAASPEKIASPVARNEFLGVQIGSALITDAGFCVHDYSLLPCQIYGDCLRCSENVFVKGDLKHRGNIAKRLGLAEVQLKEAENAVAERYRGSDRWLRLHRENISQMIRMLAVHDDPTIPDGTVVNLSNTDRDNEIAMAIRDRSSIEASTETKSRNSAGSSLALNFWED